MEAERKDLFGIRGFVEMMTNDLPVTCSTNDFILRAETVGRKSLERLPKSTSSDTVQASGSLMITLYWFSATNRIQTKIKQN